VATPTGLEPVLPP